MKVVLVILGLLTLISSGADITVRVGVSNPVFKTTPTFASFNFDWWPKSQAPWRDAGMLNIDLTNPSLVYLTSHLTPAHLRIGGTLGDTIIYAFGDHLPCQNGINCLNETRWDQINAFAKQTGVSIVFGLNEMYDDRKMNEKWNTSNVESLLSLTAKKGYSIYGFEIGNELNMRLSPQDSASDAIALQSLLAKYWPEKSMRPKLIAPDDGFSASWWNTYVQLSAGHVDIYTYHAYNGYGGNPNLPEDIPTTKFLDESSQYAEEVLALVSKYTKAEVWLGEGAAAYDSGQNDTTNAFESGFYYINALGTQARHNHTGSQRQALVGGYYELIDKFSFEPNPDYYSVYLWKKLMDVNVLDTTYPSQTNIRIYAHCTPKSTGSVTLAVINVSKNETYSIMVPNFAVYPRHEYLMNAPNGNLRSRSVELNGVELKYSTGKLPDLNPKVITSNEPLQIKPLTYGFVVLPNANAPACK